MKKRFLSTFLAFALVFGLVVPSLQAQAADSRTEAYQAYYDFLSDEIANMGKPIRDPDYYHMFTENLTKPSIDTKILGAWLRDVTGDGVEELIYKKLVTNTSTSIIDSSEEEWICIYSFINSSLKRIGQSGRWVQKVNGSYSYYEPEGYIGTILSFYDNPYISDECLYICKGADGKPYLADDKPVTGGETTFCFYSFNGSVMQERDMLSILFIPDWRVGSITSDYGRYHYEINRETVSASTFQNKVNAYSSGGVEKLVNNDYMTVCNQLAAAIPSYLTHYSTPSSWAVSSVETAKKAGFLPEELQKKYDQPITRREFCLLAATYYEHTTGMTISERSSFTDTQDLSVQKMGGLGIVNGVGDGRFSPDSKLTRQEAATILARLSAALGNTLPDGLTEYADNDLIADWAKVQVGQMAAAGIMNGTGDNNFSPGLPYTREQATATLVRLDASGVQVSNISLNRSSLRLELGEQSSLTCKIEPKDAMNQQITWTSSDPDVAQVDSSGTVTARDVGSATITATTANGLSARCSVIVSAPSEKYMTDMSKRIKLSKSFLNSTVTGEVVVADMENREFWMDGKFHSDFLTVTFKATDSSHEKGSLSSMKIRCTVYTYDGNYVTYSDEYLPMTSVGKTEKIEFCLINTNPDTYYRVEFSSCG